MLLFLIYLLPILISGILIIRKTTNLGRIELILPVGNILGLIIFTFFLNIVAFLMRGYVGIIIAYSLTICLGLSFNRFIKSKEEKIDFPKGMEFLFWILSIFGWGGFIFWKSAYALIGSDTNLYYAIAHSFVKGNFPFLTPWQPDIPLSYHTGASELLGAFYFFSGLDFQFLHLIFSAIFIFCAVQIVVWLMKRHDTVMGFLLANLATAVTFISFGFIYITWFILPFQLPTTSNINQLIIWLRNLPTVNQAIEVYGAPINLDALIYFIFHAYGIAIFFSLVALLLNCSRERPLMGWIVICIGLASLALVNESLFTAVLPALLLGIFLVELKERTLFKHLKALFLLLVLTILVVLFQGGIISSTIRSPANTNKFFSSAIEKSVIVFPKKEDIKDDFIGYHSGQEMSKILPLKTERFPLRWFHVGVDLLLVLSLITVFMIKSNFSHSILIKILFMAGLSSLVAYNVIVPKFLVANGNRFLSASFLFFSLLLCLSLIPIWGNIKKSLPKKILFPIFIGWIFIPTTLPPLALLSKTRFGENKLTPKLLQSSPGILWLRNNINFNARVMVLDKNAPHPSGQARALVEAGVFAPTFYGNFRAFTIEASPEYIDIAYYLSPRALRKLKISTLLIDSTFYDTIPEFRRKQLGNKEYFNQIFDNSNNLTDWEKIYSVKDNYLSNGGELEGTFASLEEVMFNRGKIYIDNEENFHPSFLRRAIIFSLRKKELYFLPQSGVYLNVEVDIPFKLPRKEGDYDYLVLSKNTDPKNICSCNNELIWKGLKGEVHLWKKVGD